MTVNHDAFDSDDGDGQDQNRLMGIGATTVMMTTTLLLIGMVVKGCVGYCLCYGG